MKILKVTLTNAITLGTQRYTEITPEAGELSFLSHGVTIEQNGTGRIIPWHAVEYVDYESSE